MYLGWRLAREEPCVKAQRKGQLGCRRSAVCIYVAEMVAIKTETAYSDP